MDKENGTTTLRKNCYNEAVYLRNRLIDQLIEKGCIRSKKIEDAFRKVPRDSFLPNFDLREAYSNGSVITRQIGIEPLSSSTAPSLMASMLEILRLEKGMKVLEIGAGTGYNAALLVEVVGDAKRVFSVDIDEETVQEARQNLTMAGYKNMTIECADGAKGFPEHAPYDRIIVTASVSKIPESLIEQLREGGVIVLPIWINGTQITPALEKQKDGTLVGLSTTIGGFMELRSQTYQEILKSSAEQPPTGTLLISSEYPELFDEKQVKLLLKSPHEEKPLPPEGILPPRGSAFFIFLALHERKSVELFLENEVDEFGFGDSAAGIVDLENNSACLFSHDNRLLVYGNSGAHERVVRLSKKWDDLKKPGVDRLQVFVYKKSQIPKLKLRSNDILFKNKLLLVRILET